MNKLRPTENPWSKSRDLIMVRKRQRWIETVKNGHYCQWPYQSTTAKMDNSANDGQNCQNEAWPLNHDGAKTSLRYCIYQLVWKNASLAKNVFSYQKFKCLLFFPRKEPNALNSNGRSVILVSYGLIKKHFKNKITY